MTTDPPITFANSYARLPDLFYAQVRPVPVCQPKLIILNSELADELCIDPEWLSGSEGVRVLAGNDIAPGSEPLAMAYAGHQFGGWSPQLGDGRAHLIGEVIDRSGVRRDIQLKGSGRTPFSRGGDGRAWIGPVLREYVVSEAMHALGIPTTRSLSAVATGETVMRERPLPGGVLARVSRCHVRVGTFEYFRARGNVAALRTLADYAIMRVCPELSNSASPARTLLEFVIRHQAGLIARWMGIGFIHGVMNTDNMSVACETIDYGPCAFLDAYDPAKTFSSIDSGGRYAFARQPEMALWNLTRLANALLPILSDDPEYAVSVAKAALEEFDDCFRSSWIHVMRSKFGLGRQLEQDESLMCRFLDILRDSQADFTLSFRSLNDALLPEASDKGQRPVAMPDPAGIISWIADWKTRLSAEHGSPTKSWEMMERANPVIIPRNHQIEAVIADAVDGTFDRLHALVAALKQPFAHEAGGGSFAAPPKPHEIVTQTFCGT